MFDVSIKKAPEVGFGGFLFLFTIDRSKSKEFIYKKRSLKNEPQEIKKATQQNNEKGVTYVTFF